MDLALQALIPAAEERAELRHVWEQATGAIPALTEFNRQRLIELDGIHTSVVTDLRTLPDAALDRLASHLRRVEPRQSGSGLAYIGALESLLRAEQERRL